MKGITNAVKIKMWQLLLLATSAFASYITYTPGTTGGVEPNRVGSFTHDGLSASTLDVRLIPGLPVKTFTVDHRKTVNGFEYIEYRSELDSAVILITNGVLSGEINIGNSSFELFERTYTETDTSLLPFSDVITQPSSGEFSPSIELDTDTVSRIDLLVVYTQKILGNQGLVRITNRVNAAMLQSQDAFDLSGININLNRVGNIELAVGLDEDNYTTSADLLVALKNDPYVQNLRQESCADLVMLITANRPDACGVAFLCSNCPAFGYGTAAYTCAIIPQRRAFMNLDTHWVPAMKLSRETVSTRIVTDGLL